MAKRIKQYLQQFHTVTAGEETAKVAYVDLPIALTRQNALLTSGKVTNNSRMFLACEIGYKVKETDLRVSIDTGYMVPIGRKSLNYYGGYHYEGQFILPFNVSDLYFAVWNPLAADYLRTQILYEVLR